MIEILIIQIIPYDWSHDCKSHDCFSSLVQLTTHFLVDSSVKMMQKTLALILFIGAASALKYFPNHQPLSDEIIDYVNNQIKTTWKAGKSFEGHGMTVSGLKRMCGVIPEPNNFKLPFRDEPYEIKDEDIPDTFDSRTQWSNCKSIS